MSDRDGPDGGPDPGPDPDARPPDDRREGGDDEGDGWRFSLADIEAREAEAEARAAAVERQRRPIEPGDPTVENAFFVLLGVLFTLFVLSRLIVG